MPRIVYCSPPRATRCNIHCKLRLDKTRPSSPLSRSFSFFLPVPRASQAFRAAELFTKLQAYRLRTRDESLSIKKRHSSESRPTIPFSRFHRAVAAQDPRDNASIAAARRLFWHRSRPPANPLLRPLFSSSIEPEGPGRDNCSSES